ncbi:MAG: hypothetical protein KGL36_06025 [Gammaproteobacteria bacterium]|nr:hypothetical protein [Gammaproteobacteria bacterium]
MAEAAFDNFGAERLIAGFTAPILPERTPDPAELDWPRLDPATRARIVALRFIRRWAVSRRSGGADHRRRRFRARILRPAWRR